MSEATTTETAHPRRTIRSVGAVLAGIVVGVLLTIGTDLVLYATRAFPPCGQPMINAGAILLLAAAGVVYGVVGSYITPQLSPDRPMQHVLVGGLMGLVVYIVGAAVLGIADLRSGPTGIRSHASPPR